MTPHMPPSHPTTLASETQATTHPAPVIGLRDFIKQLRNNNELYIIKRATDPRFEISSVLSLRKTGPAQFFENVTGHSMPVIGNVFNSRARIARSLGIPANALATHCLNALTNPIKPVLVDTAPVQAHVKTTDIDLMADLPVPHWFEREAAPYITAGVIIAKDPETGKRNVSIARLRLEGGNRIMAGIAKNHHLYRLADKALARGHDLEIAVVIGNDAALLLGSQMYMALGDDEYDIAGGLQGSPVELVRCKTVDLEVPAHAEIVLEGTLSPSELIDEGPVSEFPGFYVNYGAGIGGAITCITHRENLVFQAILPGYAPEHCLLGAIAIEAGLAFQMQKTIPCVTRVVVTDGGMGRLHAVIAMHQPRAGEGKRAILLAMGLVNLLKHVVVVEDDIDPENPQDVEWSLAARFRGQEDLVVIEGVKADRCDPIHEGLTVTKIGMVATTRPGDGAKDSRSEFCTPPQDIFNRVRDALDQY